MRLHCCRSWRRGSDHLAYDSWHVEWNCRISDPREIWDQCVILRTPLNWGSQNYTLWPWWSCHDICSPFFTTSMPSSRGINLVWNHFNLQYVHVVSSWFIFSECLYFELPILANPIAVIRWLQASFHWFHCFFFFTWKTKKECHRFRS